jgi:hypothetical protein
MQQGKILDYWKSYARDVCPLIFYFTALVSRAYFRRRRSFSKLFGENQPYLPMLRSKDN